MEPILPKTEPTPAKKVLVVDDEKDFLFLMEYWLKSKGYEAKGLTDGTKAVDELKSFKPDLVLLDLSMPGIDGVEVLRRIREVDADIPVIIITAYVEDERVAKFSAYRISGLFYKNKDFQEGLSLLDLVLRTHKKLKPPLSNKQ